MLLRSAKGEERLDLDHQNLYLRGLNAFHAAIRDRRKKPAATGEDGVRSMALAVAAAKSARTGREVPVEPGL